MMRKEHLQCVKEMVCQMDLFIFTLGLTECWEDRRTGTIYPLAPGVLCGKFNPHLFKLKNFNYTEIFNDFLLMQEIMIIKIQKWIFL
jgi:hypothetical protein